MRRIAAPLSRAIAPNCTFEWAFTIAAYKLRPFRLLPQRMYLWPPCTPPDLSAAGWPTWIALRVWIRPQSQGIMENQWSPPSVTAKLGHVDVVGSAFAVRGEDPSRRTFDHLQC